MAIIRRVFNFSGGKSSAMATLISDPQPEDIILFDDTTREHPLTYKFIEDFEKYEGLKVHTAAYTHTRSPGLVGFDAMNNNKSYLPNRTKRICTTELKVETTKRYLKSLGIKQIEQFIGFRADEERRVKSFKPTWKNSTTRFPLYEQGINKAMVNEFWANKPYNLEIPPILGNCDLCFLKGKNAIIKILSHYPDLAEKWIRDEEEMSKKKKNGPARYFKDVTYKQLLAAAQSQTALFEGNSLYDIPPAYSCSCNNF